MIRLNNGTKFRNTSIFRKIALDQDRTSAIANETSSAFGQGRQVLGLTERTDHLDDTASALVSMKLPPFVLHGRLSKKSVRCLFLN